MNVRERVYELDLLRFIAASAVVLFHYGFRGAAEGGFTDIGFPELADAAKYGYLGIHVFFIISGFVILMSADGSSPLRFVAGRISRLYPAFWIAVTLTTLGTVLIGAPQFTTSLPQYLLNLTMVGKALGVEYVDGVYWTLLIELQFYALIFFVMLSGRMSRIVWVLMVWLGIAILADLAGFPKPLRDALVTEYAACFIAGALFYLLRRDGNRPLLWLMLAACFAVVLYKAANEARTAEVDFLSYFSFPVIAGILALAFALFSLMAMRRIRLPGSRLAVLLGSLTYPLYLIHQHIGYMVFNHFGTEENRYGLLLLLLATVLLLSFAIHLWSERHFRSPLRDAVLHLAARSTRLMSWLDRPVAGKSPNRP